MGSSYRFRVLTHIVYSAIITCLVEVFLITNLSMVARYIQQSGKVSALVHFILGQHLAVVILYVLLGIVIFSDLYDFGGAWDPLSGKDFGCGSEHFPGQFKYGSGCDRGRRIFRHGGKFKQDVLRYPKAYG